MLAFHKNPYLSYRIQYAFSCCTSKTLTFLTPRRVSHCVFVGWQAHSSLPFVMQFSTSTILTCVGVLAFAATSFAQNSPAPAGAKTDAKSPKEASKEAAKSDAKPAAAASAQPAPKTVAPAAPIKLMQSGEKAPEAVTATFKEKFPMVKSVKWEKEHGNFEGAFRDEKNVKMSATFTKKGEWLETERDIKITEAPAEVTAAIKADYPKWRFSHASKIEKADGSFVYEGDLTEGDRKKEVLYNAEGKKVKK